MTPPILARVAQLHGKLGPSEDADCDTISTATSWEYVSKSSSLSDLTRLGAAFSSSSSAANNHQIRQDISQSSVFSSSSHIQSNHNNVRGILPHGIVPLPPPHRNSNHNNGFHGYRLTQKDLLQPQPSLSSTNNGVTPPPRDTTFHPKDDSNPVMRSTSLNLDCGAARKYTYKFRKTQEIVAPLAEVPSRKGPQNLNKPQQKGIVFVAENPENGGCDVYNVPFQSDIYSLPVDSIASAASAIDRKKVGRSNSICNSKIISNATSSSSSFTNIIPPSLITPSTTVTKASSSISQHHSNHNQNQRLKSSEPLPPPATGATTVISSSASNCSSNTNGATPPPPQRKNNLNRRRSREDNGGSNVLESCNIKCSPPPPPPPPQKQQELPTPPPASCKPPQRWSSLSVQAPSSSPPKKELPNICPESASASTAEIKQPVYAVSSKKAKAAAPPPPPHHHHSKITVFPVNNALTESRKVENLEKSLNNLSSSTTINLIGKPLNTVVPPKQETVSKKPRSRSVDPTGGEKSSSENQHYLPQNTKFSSGISTTNANQRMSTNNLNYIDNPNNHPLPPEPIENSHKESNGTHATTADRKNPLGLSFLNLFRRNKSGGVATAGGSTSTVGKQQNTHFQVAKTVEEDSHLNHSESEFMSLVPSSAGLDDNTGAGEVGGSNANGVPVNVNNNKEDASYYFRELPPPPPGEHSDDSCSDGHGSPLATSPMECRDFAASIERVKDCGWYWGPLSSEAAEDLLKNEPDGSFIVRDSSDARYIFSLTFKLHGLVRHVRIEHDQGNFSFGPLTRFKAATIVDFVEKAVAHSRSGRYLFFLHRRPVLGPMQVQLLHPYSRFMHPRSLKHMCRFVILKYVRRDLIHTLPLPKPLQDYLNTPHYYFEPPDRVTGSSSSGTVNGGGITTSTANLRSSGGGHHHHPQSTFNTRIV